MAELSSQDKGSSRRPRILDYLGVGNLDEHRAREVAQSLVRNTRAQGIRFAAEREAPDPAEVRRHREIHQQSR